MRNAELAEIEARAGIVFPQAVDWMPRERLDNGDWGAINVRQAFDAQPSLITNSNAGIPAFLTTYLDPKLVTVLLTPNKAAEIYGETRKGTWTDETAIFPMIESTGEVSSYGDFTENGRAGANYQFENRQSYLYQVFTEWGEREMERAGRANIDWAARLNIASAIALNKAQNYYYFYGVSGLMNYGALNDPSLNPAITPASKAAGGTGWVNATPSEILADVQAAFKQLQIQTGSNLELTDKLTLALHSVSEVYLANSNSYGLTAAEMIKKVFPNIRIIQAPQFVSGTTYSFQLFVEEIEGQRTVETAFNEKMRAHPVIQAASSWKQKKTQGAWGAIWYVPAAVVTMSGI